MMILVVNVGSTSLKFKLFSIASVKGTEELLAQGKVERIGQRTSNFEFCRRASQTVKGSKPFPDYLRAIQEMINFLTDASSSVLASVEQLDAVAFKTVHAGYVPEAVELTDEVLGRMEEFSIVAPSHNPAYIRAIRTFRQLLPERPLIGLFEPSFHNTIPDYAYLYAVPLEWVERYGIRRYGFHGASHRYIAERVPEILGRPAKGLKLISCHLGGSSSIAAIKDGASIDTSMGFSPQSGVPHGSRPNDLDPFAILYLMKKEGWDVEQTANVLCTECGLLGLSGVSAEFKDIERAIAEGNKRAELAVNVFSYNIKKYIGAYIVALGGLDALAFTGGIGERSPNLRQRVCSGLEFLGIKLDKEKNLIASSLCHSERSEESTRRSSRGAPASGEADVSTPDSAVHILIIPTNEELIVARAAAALLEKSRS
jgi:acetate kinase